jgi:hypothetical protein
MGLLPVIVGALKLTTALVLPAVTPVITGEPGTVLVGVTVGGVVGGAELPAALFAATAIL